jgi:hypothetical protein
MVKINWESMAKPTDCHPWALPLPLMKTVV